MKGEGSGRGACIHPTEILYGGFLATLSLQLGMWRCGGDLMNPVSGSSKIHAYLMMQKL